MATFRTENATHKLPDFVKCNIREICDLIHELQPQTLTELEDSMTLPDYTKHLKYANAQTLKFLEEVVRKECIARTLHERQDRLQTLQRFADGKHDPAVCAIMNGHLKKCRIVPTNFKTAIRDLLALTSYKKNTIFIHGCIDSGKSLIAQALVEPFVCYRGTMTGISGDHYFDDMLQKSIILIEEGWILQAFADDYKSILSGYPLSLNLKHVRQRSKLLRTPVIITSNYPDLGRQYLRNVDEIALKARCVMFNFNKKFQCDRFLTQKQICSWILCDSC